MLEAVSPLPQYAFMAWCSVKKKHRDFITFYYLYKGKVKVKFFLFFNLAPHYEGVLGSGGIAPRVIDLGTRWR
jgi:hypothetical protein